MNFNWKNIASINLPKGMRGIFTLALFVLIISTIPNSSKAELGSITSSPGCQVEGLTYRVVSCIRDVLDASVIKIFATPAFINMFRTIAGTACTLALILFGLRLSLGAVQKPTSESILMFIKMGFIFYAFTSFAAYYNSAVAISEDLISVTTSTITSGLENPGLAKSCATAAGTKASERTWGRVDCMLGAFLGFGTVTGSVFLGIGPVLEGALGSSVDPKMYGMIGPLIVYFGYMMIFGLLMAVLRAVYMFIYSMVTLSFLWILLPAAVITLLFNYTTRYFLKWMRMVFSMLIQPCLVLGFLAFMISAMDKALYTSPYSVLAAITGNNACDGGSCSYENWNKLLKEASNSGKIGQCSINLFNTNNNLVDMVGCVGIQTNRVQNANRPQQAGSTYSMDALADPKCLQQMPNAVSGFASGFSGFTNFALDTTCMQGNNPNEIFAAFIVVAIMAFVLYNTMEYIPNMAGEMVGMKSAISASYNSMPFTSELKGAVSSSANAMSSPLAKGASPESRYSNALTEFVRGSGQNSTLPFAAPIMDALAGTNTPAPANPAAKPVQNPKNPKSS